MVAAHSLSADIVISRPTMTAGKKGRLMVAMDAGQKFQAQSGPMSTGSYMSMIMLIAYNMHLGLLTVAGNTQCGQYVALT